MPHIRVQGLPGDTLLARRQELSNAIRYAVASVKELGIPANQVSPTLLENMDQSHAGEEIIVIIEGLYERPDRTPEVLAKLRDAIGRSLLIYIKGYLPQCNYVEVFIASTVKQEEVLVLDPAKCPDCQGKSDQFENYCVTCAGLGVPIPKSDED